MAGEFDSLMDQWDAFDAELDNEAGALALRLRKAQERALAAFKTGHERAAHREERIAAIEKKVTVLERAAIGGNGSPAGIKVDPTSAASPSLKDGNEDRRARNFSGLHPSQRSSMSEPLK